MSGGEEFEVKKVLSKRVRSTGRIEYLVKWKNFPTSQNTWISVENLSRRCQDMIDEYELSRVPLSSESSCDEEEMPSWVRMVSKIKSRRKCESKGDVSRSQIGRPSVAKKLKEKPSKICKQETEDHSRGYRKAERILSLSKTDGQMFSVIKWEGVEKTSVVPIEVAHEQYPHLLIEFYEGHITFGD